MLFLLLIPDSVCSSLPSCVTTSHCMKLAVNVVHVLQPVQPTTARLIQGSLKSRSLRIIMIHTILLYQLSHFDPQTTKELHLQETTAQKEAREELEIKYSPARELSSRADFKKYCKILFSKKAFLVQSTDTSSNPFYSPPPPRQNWWNSLPKVMILIRDTKQRLHEIHWFWYWYFVWRHFSNTTIKGNEWYLTVFRREQN